MTLRVPTQKAGLHHAATAIPATVATEEQQKVEVVAEIAAVAVASPWPQTVISGQSTVSDEGPPPANSANPAGELALAESQALATRDDKGRFISGNNGGGRPKGSRNRLTEVLMSAIADDFVEHGADVIAQVRTADPATYLRIVVAMVPPELILRRELEPAFDYADLTYEEAGKLADAQRKRQIIRRAIEGG